MRFIRKQDFNYVLVAGCLHWYFQATKIDAFFLRKMMQKPIMFFQFLHRRTSTLLLQGGYAYLFPWKFYVLYIEIMMQTHNLCFIRKCISNYLLVGERPFSFVFAFKNWDYLNRKSDVVCLMHRKRNTLHIF